MSPTRRKARPSDARWGFARGGALLLLAAVALCSAGLVVALVTQAGESDPRPERDRIPQFRARALFAGRHVGRSYAPEPLRLFRDADLAVAKTELDGELRNALAFARSATVEQSLTPSDGQRLCFCVGAEGAEDSDPTCSLRVAVLRDSDGQELLSREWEARHLRASWQPASLDLAPWAGTPLTVRIEARMAQRDEEPGLRLLVSEPRLADGRPSDRPNVLLLTIETCRRDHMSLYGYGRRTTPFLEELAAQALVFEQAYSQSSWTRPSVASFLTGLYPSQHGALSVLDSLGQDAVTLAEVLRGEGYTTAAFCTSPVISTPVFGYHQGFDLFVNEGVRPAEQIKQDILGWLDAEAQAPFFVFAHTYDPHAPYEAPGDHRDVFSGDYEGPLAELEVLAPPTIKDQPHIEAADAHYVEARYDAEILYTDAILRELVAGLKTRGVWKETLLVLSSDHGEELGEHGNWGHGTNLRVEKISVPLLVRLPGGRLGGRRVAGLASGVDVFATILARLGIDPPEGIPARDLVGDLAALGHTGRQEHFAEYVHYRYLEQDNVRAEPAYSEGSLLSGGHQCVHRARLRRDGPAAQWLYDLSEPLAEQEDVSEQRPELAGSYMQSLEREYGCEGWTVAVISPGTDRRVRGTARTDGQIVAATGLGLEGEDSFECDAEGTLLRFELHTRNETDMLHFRTDPPGAAVTISLEPHEGELPLYLGPGLAPCPQPSVTLGAGPGQADAPVGQPIRCDRRQDGGAFIWRRLPASRPRPQQAGPEQQTLDQLRDLGYL